MKCHGRRPRAASSRGQQASAPSSPPSLSRLDCVRESGTGRGACNPEDLGECLHSCSHARHQRNDTDHHDWTARAKGRSACGSHIRGAFRASSSPLCIRRGGELEAPGGTRPRSHLARFPRPVRSSTSHQPVGREGKRTAMTGWRKIRKGSHKLIMGLPSRYPQSSPRCTPADRQQRRDPAVSVVALADSRLGSGTR
jgi:hypothetical protein